jgi:hypothetical protein
MASLAASPGKKTNRHGINASVRLSLDSVLMKVLLL